MEECNEDQVQVVWDWCSDAYLRYGQRLTFPSATDKRKTYQWRYAKALARKFDQWGFDDSTSRKFIDIAVGHAKHIGVLRKGLAVLHQSNMLDICYKKLQEQSDRNMQEVDSITSMKKWFDNMVGNDRAILLYRSNPRAYCNITTWYKANKISALFLALSRSCTYALSQLSPEERQVLPSVERLFLLRSRVVDDLSTFKKLRRIFETDWREVCQ